MDSAIGRMKRLDVVEIVGNSPHLDHTLPVVGRQALDLGPPLDAISTNMQFSRGLEVLPVLEPDLNLPRTQSRNLPR